jgi:peptidoglycan/LPS O-acetylase OafA/YrhL
LRAVAVLAVVLYHAGIGAIGGGYVGVDVFFVISGFLITTNLYRELDRTGRISFAGFYGRRMIRLLPASTAVLVATVAAAWQWMSPLAARAVSIDALTAVGYGINVRLAMQGTDYLAAAREPSPLQHFWSLAVEEQFYVVWPVLLVVASAAWMRRGRPSRRSAAAALAALAAGSLALCVWQTHQAQPWAYFGIQARAWELAAGALVALAADRLSRLPRAAAEVAMWAGLAAVFGAALAYTDATLFPGYAAVLPVAGAALVVAGGCARPGAAAAVLGVRPMRAIGGLSYSWYLWHWPVLTIGRSVADHPLGPWLGVALAAASLLPAWLSLRLLENPVRFHAALRRRPRRGLALGAALSAVTVGAAVIVMGLPIRLGAGTARDTARAVAAAPSEDPAARLAEARRQLLALVAESASRSAMPANLVPPVTSAATDLPRDKGCLASLDDTSTAAAVAAGCDRYGDAASATTMVLFGDSHTEQWFDAVNAVAQARHWRLVVLTKSGCTPANAYTIKINARRAFTECAAWREDAFAVMASLKPALVVMSTRTYLASPVDRNGQPVKGPPDQLWTTAMLEAATRVQRTGARVVLMQDTPDPGGTSVPDCVAARPTAVQRCALPVRTAIYDSRKAALVAAAGPAGMTVVDPTPWFCTDTVCPAIVGNTLVYRDGSHVTSTYLRLLSTLLDGELPKG